MPRLHDFLQLVRAPAGLSVPGDAMAGAAAAGVLSPRSVALAAASVCLYWAGMAGNDWADRRLDAVERPSRPIPSGRVSPGAALGLAAGLTAAGLAVAGLTGGRRALAVAVPLAGAVWAYNLGLKNTPLGPSTMAICRGLDVLLGATPGRLRKAIQPALTIAAHTYTVTALSRREVDGAVPALPAATLAATVAVAAASRHPFHTGSYLYGYGTAQLRAIAEPSARRIRSAVGAGITGLPSLQAALTARAGSPLAGTVIAAAAPLGRRLARKVAPT